MTYANCVHINGFVTKDPKDHSYQDGEHFCTFCIKHIYRYKDSQNKWTEKSFFFNIKAFSTLADTCLNDCKSGVAVNVQGRLKQERWNSGDKETHIPFIIAQSIEVVKSAAFIKDAFKTPQNTSNQSTNDKDQSTNDFPPTSKTSSSRQSEIQGILDANSALCNLSPESDF